MAALGLAAPWPRSWAVMILGGLIAFFFAQRLPEKPLLRASQAALGVVGATILLGLFAAPAPPVERHPAPASAPNIILISIDSLRADHLHSHGYPRRTSRAQ